MLNHGLNIYHNLVNTTKFLLLRVIKNIMNTTFNLNNVKIKIDTLHYNK